MRTQRSVLVWCSIVLSAVLLWAGGRLPTMGAPTAETVTVGFTLPLTGAAAREGQESLEGAQLAVRLLNEAGGVRVGGRTVRFEIVSEDDRCTPAGGTEAANRLVARRVQFVGGSFCSGAAVAQQPVFAQARIPQVIYAFATDLTGAARQRAGAVLSVRLGPQAVIEMAPLAKYAVTVNNHRRFFAMAQNTDFGRSMITEFRRVLERLGGRLVADPEFYTFPGTTDFRTILTKARGSGADGLVAMGLGGEMIGVSLQFRELGLAMGFYGSDLLEDPAYQDAVGERANGFFYPWVYDDGVDLRRFTRTEPERMAREMSLAFLNTLRKRATRNHGWGWGTIHLLKQAMEREGSTEPERVMRRILSGERFELPLGTYGFLPCGQADMRVGVATYVDGRRTLLVDRDFAGRPPAVLSAADLCPR
ncbi:MAG: ABC transporter substrate-binding protein [Armatimonadota bacterium]|nr:ABC transporter substrate-binding protein [Armatimonadota bacterium]MDR7449822.1 ABC transporter substrate-binding protein [Armatimonadota bacterium]MDR7460754.1 ABC transporter substrate-binding protein [Armatimonadota bacterium]MDR7480646.1 ABC transporter substrate-binding protein [Armatimonadota bacterium]MDR7488364.1 ABC transporter substrate-binding protein [Armatimonadota bacterium]